ncbi:MAG TPA: rhodanese-like domain-containing protein [Thermoanaerobaculia bacterium]|jgi:thiosulfate/3-mercaptopyruvate sulfurtransferase|nr:rhodanese-like domain-containing protein [Thermoanaerobaculia bacterium]HQN09413.1 rhodanese-like domain-containing protein [Thermoanaerobaculia bacterium]HQP87295.1 rhodanese-like domain-containing protein [Thermoanaerobaculia bacterium]
MRSRVAPGAVAARLALFGLLLVPAATSRAAGEAVPPVVSGGWLEPKLASAEIVLLDARPLRDFLASHLPGARSVAVENLRATRGGVPATLHPPELLGTIFAGAGVTPRAHVVVYGAESDVDATYVATAARVAGATRVSVLDGGFARWSADLRPVRVERTRFPVPVARLRGERRLVIDLEEVAKRVGDGRTVLLDVRQAAQWAKERIPGAKNRPWKADVSDGLFRPADRLRADYEAAGVSWEKPVVVYCNSGHQASEAFWVLKYVLGHPDVRLYQGSWLEWSMTPGTPREGDRPAEER